MSKTVRVRISGRVQGVGYRAWTEMEAKARGLSGWVRNRTDGSVEALISGSASAVDDFIAALWQGPRSAKVSSVSVAPDPAPSGTGFRTLPTA